MELITHRYLDLREQIDPQIQKIQTFAETLQMIGQADHIEIKHDPIELLGSEILHSSLQVMEKLDDFASISTVKTALGEETEDE
ncbi:MAG TPA: hypothetical protein DIV46_08440 [Verrucomicrobiales bacterium]|nr:hypothetical protein [Verrucomicrobiales bacterium]|tara:strand:+ start:972 stop:1223 length:252 start_codon:yes stop_codon:yes gene_type:complete